MFSDEAVMVVPEDRIRTVIEAMLGDGFTIFGSVVNGAWIVVAPPTGAGDLFVISRMEDESGVQEEIVDRIHSVCERLGLERPPDFLEARDADSSRGWFTWCGSIMANAAPKAAGIDG